MRLQSSACNATVFLPDHLYPQYCTTLGSASFCGAALCCGFPGGRAPHFVGNPPLPAARGPRRRPPPPFFRLNGEAAALLLRDPEAYRAKVQAYVHRYASGKPAAAEAPPSEAGSSSGGGNDSADEQKDEEEEGGSATDGIFKMEDVTMDDSDNDSDVSELSDIDT